MSINTKFGFTIRGQEFVFDTREEYLKWFNRALDLAREQQLDIEEGIRKGDLEPFQDQIIDEDTQFERQVEDRENENSLHL